MAFLGFQAEGGDRPGIESAHADRLAGFFTITEGVFGQPLQCGVDLGDQLAFAVAGPGKYSIDEKGKA